MGGAELTQKGFRQCAPPHIQILSSHPEEIPTDVDGYVVHNCTEYSASLIPLLSSKPVIKYHHDLWPHGDHALRAFICDYALQIYTSEPHYNWFRKCWTGRSDYHLVPPYINYSIWRQAKTEEADSPPLGDACWFGRFFPEKGIKQVEEWAEENEKVVAFYGSGPSKPRPSEFVRLAGSIAYGDLPPIIAQYATMIHLPLEREPFGRSVAEAHAAGLEIVTNGRVGARWWIENQPHQLDEENTGRAFWHLVEEHIATT
jgi:glycosyltransferase involved in cell wall biosynthesis